MKTCGGSAWRSVVACMVLGLAMSGLSAVAGTGVPPEPETPADDPIAERFSLTWSVQAATDDFDTGLTTTDHKPYGETRITLGFDLFRVEAAAWTEGGDLSGAYEVLAGVSPSIGGVDLDASLLRRQSPDVPSIDKWIADANATFALFDGATLNVGVSRTMPDVGNGYTDLYAGLDVTLPNGWTVSGDVDGEPDDGTGEVYLQAIAGVTVPLPRDFALSAELGYEWYADDAVPDYWHWNAGVTWTAMEGVAFDLRWYGNDLGGGECGLQADYDCEGRILASMTYDGRWPSVE